MSIRKGNQPELQERQQRSDQLYGGQHDPQRSEEHDVAALGDDAAGGVI